MRARTGLGATYRARSAACTLLAEETPTETADFTAAPSRAAHLFSRIRVNEGEAYEDLDFRESECFFRDGGDGKREGEGWRRIGDRLWLAAR